MTLDLDGTEDYIVLACDGLWDTVTQESISDIVYNHLQETNGDKSSVARKLVTVAKDNGSSDNITVIVVFLRDEIAEPQIKQLFDFTGGDSQGNNDVEKGDNSRGDDSDKMGSDKPNSKLPDNSNTSDTNVDSHKTDNKVNNSQTSEQSHNLPITSKDHNNSVVLDHSQNFLTVKSSNQDSGNLSEISDHSSETPEISAVRKVNQKDLNVGSKTLSPDEELPVLKKENVFIFEGYHPPAEIPPSSVEGRSSSLPSCLQMSDNFQTAIQDGHVLSDSQPEARDVDTFLNLQGQSYSPENKTHLENRNFMASNIKKNSRNKAMMERFKNLDYLTADGLPDKELLAPISYGKQKHTKKKVKKSKKAGKKFESFKDSENSPRKPNNNRKSLENIPVVWSFAGSNKALVKNHKLLHAAKSVRVALSTVGGNEKSDSSPHIKSDSTERMATTTEKVAKPKHISYYDQRDIENLVVPHPVFGASPPASFNNSTTPLISSSTSSLPPVVHPTLAMYGSKSPANPTPEKFHMTWKPRRVHRASNGVLGEVPPTPFMNIRISKNSEGEDE